MKYIIQDGVYGEEKFPIPFNKIKSLTCSCRGDFKRPYYHSALCALWYEKESNRCWYQTIGTFKKGKPCRKFLFFGKIISGKLSGFETKYRKEDIKYLIEHFEGE